MGGAAVSKQYCYFFGNGIAQGSAVMKNLLGGKGANLHEMTQIGIRVPPGFTISTEACIFYMQNNNTFPPELLKETEQNMERLRDTFSKNRKTNDPLLVSVRSGARISMPGMMDTILNLGLNDLSADNLTCLTLKPRFTYDCYRRLLQMFGNVVLGIQSEEFETILCQKKKECGVTLDTDLSVSDMCDVVRKYKALIRDKTGHDFPADPRAQLELAIQAVFNSWNNERAFKYRKYYKIPDGWGTAANIQAMVFGNMGDTSGTGVLFTRDPATGEKKVVGEFLRNGQGEDVVAGIRTPQPLSALAKIMPDVYDELMHNCKLIEQHFKDMMDIEFTIENKVLYILQCRSGKRTAAAEIKIATDMEREGLIDRETALMRVNPSRISELSHPIISPSSKTKPIAQGLAGSPGTATGNAVFTSEDAQSSKQNNIATILVRQKTSPEDIGGMVAAEGILTAEGGMTSHAVLVARGMDKPCVAGCGDIHIISDSCEIKGNIVHKGDTITIDGTSGNIFLGSLPLVAPANMHESLATVCNWTNTFRVLRVRANADTPEDAKFAVKNGAEGIGLCRTEHMFFGTEERIRIFREMIIAENKTERVRALTRILSLQQDDFTEIFKIMAGLPVTIRLLDPPLAEFLPKDNFEKIAKDLSVSTETIAKRVESLREVNPMLGERGCRLGITYPEITEMQAHAIFQASCELIKEGIAVIPEIMIPLVSTVSEFTNQKTIIDRVAQTVCADYGVRVPYCVGTMIETPRSCIIAGQLAEHAEFFSFGTNDLTQMSYGISRDDGWKFIPKYLEEKILSEDPFVSIDEEGVGLLMRYAVTEGRAIKPNLKIGICGEHGGDPKSVAFCHNLGLDYVSCSPPRIPVAQIAAAQAAIKNKTK